MTLKLREGMLLALRSKAISEILLELDKNITCKW